jgi:hypothetical protein
LSSQLTKNGSVIANTFSNISQYWASTSLEATVDANGSDYFELQAYNNVAGASTQSANTVQFTAFPLTGMQGPTGGAPGPVVGDFYAMFVGGPITLPASPTVTAFNSVINGNSGAYYNTTTGRYTPPAGRYCISTGFSIQQTSTNPSSALISIRKNGTTVITSANTPNPSNGYGGPAVAQITADANGSDFFDVVTSQTSGTGLQFNVYAGTTWFTAFPTQGMVGPQGSIGPSGPDSKLLQTVSFETGAVATGTTVIPGDDTIPQITEGDQYMTLAITPRSATSKLLIDVTMLLSFSVAGSGINGALFQDSTANALAASTNFSTTANGAMQFRIHHGMTSGTTSATTFRVRAGGGVAGTTTFNGTGGGRYFGGAMASSIVIREEAP